MMAWWSVSWTTVNPLNPSYWSTESSRVVSGPQRCSVKISAMLSDAFRDCELGIVIRYSADGKLFNPRRMQAVTKVRKTVLRNFLFADDCTINTRNEQEMQAWMDRFFLACNNFGLTISTKKTEVMFQQEIVVPRSTLPVAKTQNRLPRNRRPYDQVRMNS